MSAPPLKGSARRVQQALAARGLDLRVREVPDSTRTAAGTPNAVFRLTPGQLVALTGGRVAAIKRT